MTNGETSSTDDPSIETVLDRVRAHDFHPVDDTSFTIDRTLEEHGIAGLEDDDVQYATCVPRLWACSEHGQRSSHSSVWFATILTPWCALFGSSTGVAGVVIFGAFGFAGGVTIVVCHLFADMLTPMGIRPFEPIRDDKYTLSVAKAANPVANDGLLVIGVLTSAVAFLAGGAVAGVLGV